MAQALPSAAIRTASSPLPSRQSACAGSTARDVSASGIPRNVDGYGIDKRVRDKGGKQCAASATGPSTAEEGDLEAEEDAGKGICMHAGNDPAGGTENDPEEGAKQDLYHGLKIRENEYKSTEMHTISYREYIRSDTSHMKIAVTRLKGKEKSDAARCAEFGHSCYSVHPLRSETPTAGDHGIRRRGAQRSSSTASSSRAPSRQRSSPPS